MEIDSIILEYIYDKMQGVDTADECRRIVQKAIVIAREHQFERLRTEFGVL
jgi:dsDNA-binding SOS-regulon protein